MFQQKEHKEARYAARSAVRAYAKDPTKNNAEQVHAAWKAIREMDEASFQQNWIGRTIALQRPLKGSFDKK